MSADNYYMIRKHPTGGFCAIECCASEDDETDPEARPGMKSWPTVDEAFDYAEMQYSEYGTRIHKECREVQTPTLFHVGDKVDTYEGPGTVLAIIQWIEYRVQVNEDGNHPWIGTFSEEDLTLLGPDPVTLLEQARTALCKLAGEYTLIRGLPPSAYVQETITALTIAIGGNHEEAT
jgi:hypothetical protein